MLGGGFAGIVGHRSVAGGVQGGDDVRRLGRPLGQGDGQLAGAQVEANGGHARHGLGGALHLAQAGGAFRSAHQEFEAARALGILAHEGGEVRPGPLTLRNVRQGFDQGHVNRRWASMTSPLALRAVALRSQAPPLWTGALR